MTERGIKAYSFYGSKVFVDEVYDEVTRERIYEALSPSVIQALTLRQQLIVAPPEYAVEIWSGIVKVHQNPRQATDQLRACGRRSGEFASTTYLRLLFKILSVKMFAEKLPQVWARD